MASATISASRTSDDSLESAAGTDAANSVYASLAEPVQGAEGEWQLSVHVEGMHCAHCIWAIESRLQTHEAVRHARVNLSTKRLYLHWRGEAADAVWLVAEVEKLGYGVSMLQQSDASRDDEHRFLMRCMAVSGFAMGNIMLLSVALWSSSQEVMGIITRDLFHWVSAMIALPTVLYAGRPFFRSAWRVLKEGHTNMDVPISLALILACAMSIHETMTSGAHAYFDSAVMLLFFLLIGRWLDARARSKALDNAGELLAMMQGSASLRAQDGSWQRVPINQLKPGMVVRVAVGEKIPTDATLIAGETQLDTSLITGETLPHDATAGDVVYGGTLNVARPVECEVLRASEQSLLADIVRLMEEAEQGRARYVRLADKAARLYTPVVHSLAAAAFLGWWLLGGLAWQEALLIAVTTLIITCPCALGLAVPAVQVLATSWLMKRGILVKSGDALERLAEITHLVCDKTGTLTHGAPQWDNQESIDPADQQCAASLASHSRHPLSQAVASPYRGSLLPMEQVQEFPGEGIEAQLEGVTMRLGRARFCGIDEAQRSQGAQDDRMELWLQYGDEAAIRFTFTDPLRADAARVLKKFKQQHIHTAMFTGDRESVAASIARKLPLDDWYARCKPADKVARLEALQRSGACVAMVGDGLNDAPALTAAHVSLSPASAIDITQNSADFVFRGDGLSPVLRAYDMARLSRRLVQQNFALAVVYNLIAIPIALLGWVTPMIAAIAMSGSSLVVVLNSFRITRFQRKEQPWTS